MHVSKAALFALLVGILASADPALAADTSPITHHGIVEAPIDQVWDAFTTSRGIESWMLPHADIELKVGGLMRTNYKADGVLGDNTTIVNKILSFQPQRMFSMQVAQAPEGFPFKKAVMAMWTVLMFEPVSSQQTRVTVTSMGFTEDEESQTMRKHFDGGNLYTLQKLQKHFAPPAKPAPEKSTAEIDGEIMQRLMHEASDDAAIAPKREDKDALSMLRTLIGGEWIVEQKRGDGGVLRARNVFEAGPDGRSVIGRGWRGDVEGMMPHANTQIWCEPIAGRDVKESSCMVRFQSVNEIGAVARGDILVTGDREIEWDWNATALDGQQERYRVKMIFDQPEQYRFILSLVGQGEGEKPQQLVDLRFTRVHDLPEAFLKLKSLH